MADFEKSLVKLLLGEKAEKAGLDSEPVFSYAEANHVLFALAQKLASKNAVEALAGKKKQYAQRLLVAKKAKDAIERRGQKAILMKSFFPFPYIDSDLDFVAIEDFEACRQALEESGFSLQESRSYRREPMKRFFALKGSRFSVHLHKAFSWNGISYLDSEKVWRDRKLFSVEGASFKVPSPSHDFLITAAHAFFENKCIYLSDFLNAALLARTGNLDWKKILEEADDFNWKQALLSFLSQLDALHVEMLGIRLLPKGLAEEKKQGFRGLVFPFILNDTFSCSMQKLLRDALSLKLRQLPRQKFSYFVVDVLLRRKALKEKRKLEALKC